MTAKPELAPRSEGTLSVTVAYSPRPREVQEWRLTLPAGSTVSQAVNAVNGGKAAVSIDGDLSQLAVGIWGRKASADQPLRDQDRVEIYRPLKVDPKVARRERFTKQGARKAGLFAKRREGAKPGY